MNLITQKLGDKMFNFFVDKENKQGEFYYINGTDYNHIANVLRMKTGDNILISCNGKSDLCEISAFESNCVSVKIIEENYQDTSLPVKITLFQGLPKSDKMELIIQKAVELGVDEITPIEMGRCVVKLDEKKKKSKTTRWQAIAESAAKQSKRTAIPTVSDTLSYKQALEKAKGLDMLLVPYESKNGMADTKEALLKIKSGMSVGIIIGPEGGFEETEIKLANDIGGITVSLGKRILRTETASIAAVSMVMLYSEMNLGE